MTRMELNRSRKQDELSQRASDAGPGMERKLGNKMLKSVWDSRGPQVIEIRRAQGDTPNRPELKEGRVYPRVTG